MSNSKWFAFKCWLSAYISRLLPDSVKRFVLYDLQERVIQRAPQYYRDKNAWNITFEALYETLEDK